MYTPNNVWAYSWCSIQELQIHTAAWGADIVMHHKEPWDHCTSQWSYDVSEDLILVLHSSVKSHSHLFLSLKGGRNSMQPPSALPFPEALMLNSVLLPFTFAFNTNDYPPPTTKKKKLKIWATFNCIVNIAVEAVLPVVVAQLEAFHASQISWLSSAHKPPLSVSWNAKNTTRQFQSSQLSLHGECTANSLAITQV